jgi:hypothetical protein
MMSLIVSLLVLAAVAAGAIFVYADTPMPSSGEGGLCAGHATAYHEPQLYWRELGQARDWESLKAQVRRWQEIARPGFGESEIEEIARNLNQAVFRFAVPA